MVPIVVYADGGCSPNPGPGGWGVVISTSEGILDLCGGESDSTNNRMELTAAIRALEHFPEGSQIEIRCDSEYVVKSITKWVATWKANGWRNKKGPVKNLDLMQRLLELAGRRDVKWTWVRGHAGNPLNERADRLVAQGRREACSQAAQTSSSSSAAAMTSAATLPPVNGAVNWRDSLVCPIDRPLARAISRAAKLAGTSQAAFTEDAVRLVLALGQEETARLRGKSGPRPYRQTD